MIIGSHCKNKKYKPHTIDKKKKVYPPPHLHQLYGPNGNNEQLPNNVLPNQMKVSINSLLECTYSLVTMSIIDVDLHWLWGCSAEVDLNCWPTSIPPQILHTRARFQWGKERKPLPHYPGGGSSLQKTK